jgi:2-oxoglutarate dehydrogenase E1 component
MLLPHGYEGQGPEHSSARLERFLELCAEDNIQVCNLTTPAQFFHALRRQLHRKFRKPLVIMSPKSLLRHKLAVSPVAEFTDGTFQPVLEDRAVDAARVKRVLVVSGKFYYALLEARGAMRREEIAIVRLEQLYPFPARELTAELARFPNATDIRWVQEEPENMGAWRHLRHRLEALLPAGARLTHVARREAASTATGFYTIHHQQEQQLIARSLGDEPVAADVRMDAESAAREGAR